MKNIKIYAEVLEEEALKQFEDVMSKDYVLKGALMADAHKGYALPIGGVVATKDVIVPAFVGYDIGCGMCAVKLDITKDNIDLNDLFHKIFDVVPVGRSMHNEKQEVMDPTSELIEEGLNKKGYYQIGTLGSGNHFLEIGEGRDGKLWIVVHSGSRNLGHFVAEYYMKEAKKLSFDETSLIEEYAKRKSNVKKYNPDAYKRGLNKFLNDEKDKLAAKVKDDEYFPLDVDSDLGKAYINDMNYCLDYALLNRKRMIESVKKLMGDPKELMFINRNHNHADFKNGLWIHRKGATHAEKGMMGVIPGNMRDGSFIVEGLGNEDSLCSSSHGAGRVLGRKAAQRELNMNDFSKTMKDAGVIGLIDEDHIDEAPDAYKNIFDVIKIQEDEGLIKVIDYVKPLLNIKG